MDRRAHFLLRAAAIAVLVVEAMLPATGTAKVDPAAPTAPAAVAAAPAPVAMR